MKHILLLAVCLAAMAITAQAQNRSNTSYSGTEYYKYSGKEYGKIWVQADPGDIKMRAEHIDPKTGKRSITIFREGAHKLPGSEKEQVTREMYMLFPDTKTGMEITIDQVQNMGVMVGIQREDGRITKKELVGLEDVNGYECHHYVTTITTTLVTGVQETGCVHAWIYEPLNVQMQSANCGYDEPITLGNFQQGSQPAHLFEIPDDYKLVDAGEQIEQMRGLIDGLKGATKEVEKQMEDPMKQLDEIEKSDMTEQEKIIEALKMLGGEKK